MKITKKDLDNAVNEEIISDEQASKLYEYLNKLPNVEPMFNFTNVLYYLGGLIAIGAMTLFMTLGWESFGGWGIFSLSIVYSIIGLVLTDKFQKKDQKIPAGICATFVVSITPLAIYGLQQALELWPDESIYKDYYRYVQWHWIYMEVGTIIVGLIVLWKYRYPFLVMPIAATLFYMSMDLSEMFIGEKYDFQFRVLFSMYFGLFMVLGTFWIDFKLAKKADYAFWLYIFGVVLFWLGVTINEFNSESSKLIYFCINIFMVFVGVIIFRRVFVVFGGIGIFMYLAHLSKDIFENSWYFSILLSILGVGMIYVGVLWNKYEKSITKKLYSILPDNLKVLFEPRVK